MSSLQQEEWLETYIEARQKAFDDPQWFFENILHFPALDWQLEGISAVFDVKRKIDNIPTKVNHGGLPRVTIRSCHGTGKTQFIALLMHIWNFVYYGKIACTAPKEAQLTRRLMPRYRRCMRDAELIYKERIDVLGKDIRVFGDPDWGAVMETASDPDNLAGYHDTPQLFLIDEASAKRLDPMFPVIEGALTTPGSCSVEIGNPTRVEGEFWAHHNKRGTKELYYRMHIKHSDAPELVSQHWVDAMATKYGINSPIYLIRVAGEFASFDEYLLISPEYIDEALDTEYPDDGSLPRLRISIDVADGGADSTVITAALKYRAHTHVIKQKAFYFDPKTATIDAADAALNMFNGFNGRKDKDEFVVDGIGVGAGTHAYLQKQGYRAIKNKGSDGVTGPYRNRRVQNYIALQNAFMDGSLTIAPDAIDDEEEFRAHLLSIKRANSDTKNYDDIETKEKIKQDGLPSPDRADSMAMLFNGEAPSIQSPSVFSPIGLGTTETANYDASLV